MLFFNFWVVDILLFKILFWVISFLKLGIGCLFIYVIGRSFFVCLCKLRTGSFSLGVYLFHLIVFFIVFIMYLKEMMNGDRNLRVLNS